MPIIVKNKGTLLYDDFKFKCSIGKKGFNKNKKEGDNTTPKGIFQLGNNLIFNSPSFNFNIIVFSSPVRLVVDNIIKINTLNNKLFIL